MDIHAKAIIYMLPAVVLPPVLLVYITMTEMPYTAITSMAVIVLGMIPFFLQFEQSKPKPRDMVPIAVMSAIGALGRTLFGAIPSFTPVTAIIMITGMQFGARAGFLAGALSALASNMFLGQGPWTPWQMYAWGMIGLLAGILQRRGILKRRWILYVFGMLCGIGFGWFLNLQYIVSYVRPVTWSAILVSYVASAPMDIIHGLSTLLFLILLEKPWGKKLHRLKVKYGICNFDTEEQLRQKEEQ